MNMLPENYIKQENYAHKTHTYSQNGFVFIGRLYIHVWTEQIKWKLLSVAVHVFNNFSNRCVKI